MGVHIPDLVTWIKGNPSYFGTAGDDAVAQLSTSGYPRLGVIGLVGEIKISEIASHGQKCYVQVHRTDDPITLDIDSDASSQPELDARSIAISFNTGISVGAAAAIDGVKKWRAGLLKALVYLISSYEFCGTRFCLVVVGPLFSRLCLSTDNHIVVECSEGYLSGAAFRTPSASQFLADEQAWTHLTWNVCDASEPESPRWCAAGMPRLLQFHRLAVEVLLAHAHQHNGNPFCPLGPLPVPVQEVLDKLVTVPHVVDDRERPVDHSRPVPFRKRGRTDADPAAVTSARDGSRSPSGDSRSAQEQDAGKRQRASRGARREGSTILAPPRSVDNEVKGDGRRLASVAHWAETVAASAAEAVGADDSTESIESQQNQTPPVDASSDSDLGTEDMSALSAQGLARDVEMNLDVSAEDLEASMMNVISARKVTLHLVTTSEMDDLVSTFSTALEQGGDLKTDDLPALSSHELAWNVGTDQSAENLEAAAMDVVGAREATVGLVTSSQMDQLIATLVSASNRRA